MLLLGSAVNHHVVFGVMRTTLIPDPLVPSVQNRVREAALNAASDLFYNRGVRAVGMDAIVESAGVPKTSIYRHFPTKDALIAAFLEREDQEFWQQWDAVTEKHKGSPQATLLGLAHWVGAKVARQGYRGCPQINVAAEFADPEHPARRIAERHKHMMVRKLTELCSELDRQTSRKRGQQIALLFDGAFMSGGRLDDCEGPKLLQDAVAHLLGMQYLTNN